jgi:hypothetical protein
MAKGHITLRKEHDRPVAFRPEVMPGNRFGISQLFPPCGERVAHVLDSDGNDVVIGRQATS